MIAQPDRVHQLFVLAFDTRVAAREGFAAAERLARDGKVALAGSVFVHKDRDGVTEVEEAAPAAPAADDHAPRELFSALAGALVAGPDGALAGAEAVGPRALVGSLVDIGIADATVEAIRCLVDPGQTALALLAVGSRREAALAELHRFAGARLVVATLNPRWVETLRATIAGSDCGARAGGPSSAGSLAS